jgi:hypothetical protein
MAIRMLGFRIANVGSEEKPELMRVWGFLRVETPVVGEHEYWEPIFGKPIPTELIHGAEEGEEFFYAATPQEEEVLELMKICDSISEMSGDSVNPLNRLADFIGKIVDPLLGPINK